MRCRSSAAGACKAFFTGDAGRSAYDVAVANGAQVHVREPQDGSEAWVLERLGPSCRSQVTSPVSRGQPPGTASESMHEDDLLLLILLSENVLLSQGVIHNHRRDCMVILRLRRRRTGRGLPIGRVERYAAGAWRKEKGIKRATAPWEEQGACPCCRSLLGRSGASLSSTLPTVPPSSSPPARCPPAVEWRIARAGG